MKLTTIHEDFEPKEETDNSGLIILTLIVIITLITVLTKKDDGKD